MLRGELTAVPKVTVIGLDWLVGAVRSATSVVLEPTLREDDAPLNKAGFAAPPFFVGIFFNLNPEAGFFGEIDRDTDRDLVLRALQDVAESAAESGLTDSSSLCRTDLAAEALVGANNLDLAESR
jgi:hypothetical protein